MILGALTWDSSAIVFGDHKPNSAMTNRRSDLGTEGGAAHPEIQLLLPKMERGSSIFF